MTIGRLYINNYTILSTRLHVLYIYILTKLNLVVQTELILYLYTYIYIYTSLYEGDVSECLCHISAIKDRYISSLFYDQPTYNVRLMCDAILKMFYLMWYEM